MRYYHHYHNLHLLFHISISINIISTYQNIIITIIIFFTSSSYHHHHHHHHHLHIIIIIISHHQSSFSHHQSSFSHHQSSSFYSLHYSVSPHPHRIPVERVLSFHHHSHWPRWEQWIHSMMMKIMIVTMMLNSTMSLKYHPAYTIILWAYIQTQVAYELWDVWYDDNDLHV